MSGNKAREVVKRLSCSQKIGLIMYMLLYKVFSIFFTVVYFYFAPYAITFLVIFASSDSTVSD